MREHFGGAEARSLLGWAAQRGLSPAALVLACLADLLRRYSLRGFQRVALPGRQNGSAAGEARLELSEEASLEDVCRRAARALDCPDARGPEDIPSFAWRSTAELSGAGPLAVSAEPEAEGLALSCAFDPGRFDPSAVGSFLRQLACLLGSAGREPERPLASMSALHEKEEARLLSAWCAAEDVPPGAGLVHELFESRARELPDRVAVDSPEGSMSYAELDRLAGRFAHRLRRAGVGPGVRVGILSDRRPELFAAILGTLKAGGAYLCMDPAAPSERLARCWGDLDADILIASAGQGDRLPLGRARLFPLEDRGAAEGAEIQEAPAPRGPTPADPAYAMFTSGSTGRPKGMLLAHRGLRGMIEASISALGVGPQDRVLQCSDFGFDVFVWETFLALCSGAALVLPGPRDRFQALAIREALRERGVTTAFLAPSLLALLSAADLSGLGKLVSVGERLPGKLAALWAPGRRLFNAYGPSEATITAAMHEIRSGEVFPRLGPPVGRPLPGVRIYILDEALRPLPAGMPGEICIGGTGVARGYLGSSPSGAERFVPDPFRGGAGALLYKTGDTGRFLPGGVLEFLWREDTQVKLSGYRVELGEIEAVLREHPGVEEAVALVKGTGNGDPGRLAAYFRPSGAVVPRTEELRAHVEERLPPYMVPRSFVALQEMPRTPGGKLDRRSLILRGG